jgi:hypothetical protein
MASVSSMAASTESVWGSGIFPRNVFKMKSNWRNATWNQVHQETKSEKRKRNNLKTSRLWNQYDSPSVQTDTASHFAESPDSLSHSANEIRCLQNCSQQQPKITCICFVRASPARFNTMAFQDPAFYAAAGVCFHPVGLSHVHHS